MATYYVSTSGNDGNVGSLGSPWKTWQKGMNTVSAGDTLYIRGGTYTGMYNTFYGVNINNHDGTALNPINIYAYPGETPILNCAGLAGAGTHYGIYLYGCVYWNFKGLTISNVREYSGFSGKGWEVSNCQHFLYELCVITGCGNGFTFAGGGVFTDIIFKNCDSYSNWDTVNTGDLCNGFGANVVAGSTITYEGCRAWQNSDDGFDFYGSEGYFTIKNCWAFNNGPWHGGDGNGNGSGIKIGAAQGPKEAGVQRTVQNCLAWSNHGIGIDESMDDGAILDENIFNNTSYDNDVNYNFVLRATNTGDVHLTNNISYAGDHANNIRVTGVTQTTNSWQGGLTVSAADFLSLDDTGTDGARESDGSLPVLDFLKLAVTSDMIDAGTDVGLPYEGSPDIGAYEYDLDPPIEPILVTSIIVSGTGGVVIIATKSGTLQMLAAVLPVNADDPTVTWSVAAGTGTGTISVSGLLTAVTDGTVTVRATANDASGIFDDQIITFSNQTISNTYYVSTSGSDANPGTLTNPWLTWHYGFNQLVAGDTLYIRGGTYTVMAGLISGAYYGARVVSKNGTLPNIITVSAYQNEVPILDCSALTGNGEHYGIKLDSCNYWYLYGLTVKSVHEFSGYTHPASGIEIGGTSETVLIEKCNVTDSGRGFTIGGTADYVQYNNCDSYLNYDYYSSGDLASGFAANIAAGKYVTYSGCRAWSNSADGFNAMAGGGYITYSNCIAYRNGYNVPTSGNGAGFTLGYTTKGDEAGNQRTVNCCLAVNNLNNGFDEAMAAVTSQDMELYNCVAYRNGGTGFKFDYAAGTGVTTLKNNITYSTVTVDSTTVDVDDAIITVDDAADISTRARNVSTYNSWDAGMPGISDDDFVSLVMSQITGGRQANGLMSIMTFLHLESNSDLIGAGEAVLGLTLDCDGYPYGTPPSLGPFEYVVAIPVTSITVTGAGLAVTIDTDNGTLQMSAAVLPVDADITTVSWSVINGTGTGWITNTGLLTAITDGTVTVRASANDDSGIYGDLIITLLNQEEDTPPQLVPYNYSNIPTYRFYVHEAPSSLTYEVFPLKFLSTQIISEKDGDREFYRDKFTGSLIFGTNSKVLDVSGVEQNRREDWELFWGFEQHDPGARIDLTITKTVSGVVTTYYEGYFSSSDGAFDIDSCTFEVTPHTSDDYSEILDIADTQFNILDVPVMGTINAVWGTIDEDYTRTRWLAKIGSNNVLEYLAQEIAGGGVTVESDFFTDAVNPVTLDDNLLLHLTIAQKSDIIRNISTDPATSALMSWNEFMAILWGMFQVKWTYDLVTNTIRVEHVSWFTSGAGVDLRTQQSCTATNKFTYLKEKMPKYEKYSFMEADGINFINNVIWYDSAAVNQDPETNSVEIYVNVTTDLEYIISNPEAISDEGFVILCNYLDGADYYVRVGLAPYGGPSKLNIDMSWANLQNCYFRHERVLIEGYLLGYLATFWTARKTRVQECTAILCEELDPTDEITTELGETYLGGAKATVKTAALSPTGETKFSLIYGPTENTNTGVPNLLSLVGFFEMQQSVVPNDKIHIDFTFNDVVPAGGIDIRIREVVFNDLGAVNYTGAWNNVNFAVGVRTQAFNHDLENPPQFLDTDWTISIEIEYDDADIDRVYLNPDDTFSYDPPFIYTII